MKKFKPGDKVKCISLKKLRRDSDNYCKISGLKRGEIYTVQEFRVPPVETSYNTPVIVLEDPSFYNHDATNFVKVRNRK